MKPSASAKDAPKPWYHPSLTKQIVIGLIVGVIGGYLINIS